jgi:hypothetical protein
MSELNSNSQLAQLVADLEEDIVLALVNQRLEAGGILYRSLTNAMKACAK